MRLREIHRFIQIYVTTNSTVQHHCLEYRQNLLLQGNTPTMYHCGNFYIFAPRIFGFFQARRILFLLALVEIKTSVNMYTLFS